MAAELSDTLRTPCERAGTHPHPPPPARANGVGLRVGPIRFVMLVVCPAGTGRAIVERAQPPAWAGSTRVLRGPAKPYPRGGSVRRVWLGLDIAPAPRALWPGDPRHVHPKRRLPAPSLHCVNERQASHHGCRRPLPHRQNEAVANFPATASSAGPPSA